MMSIAYIFKTDAKGILYLFKALKRRKYKDDDGLDKRECDMLIGALAAAQRVDVEYTHINMKFKQFLKENKTGRFLINQEGHVSCVENGRIVDEWGVYDEKITGYWKITGRNSLVTQSALDRKKELNEIIKQSIRENMIVVMERMKFRLSFT